MARRQFNTYLDEDLQDALRQEAFRERIKLTEAVEAAVRAYLEQKRESRGRKPRSRDRPEKEG